MIRSFFKSFCATCGLIGRLFKDYVRLVRGVWRLSKLPQPIVTVFGGSKIDQGHAYAKQAGELGELLMKSNISVITGGGPGIMQAANCGAFKTKNSNGVARSVGIALKNLEQEKYNECSDDFIVTRYFFARKWLLTNYATAFVVFPGGYGTLDELSQILTLMQTGRINRVPVVLINKNYWASILDWVKMAEKEGLLLACDVDLIFVTDDIQEAFRHLRGACEEHPQQDAHITKE